MAINEEVLDKLLENYQKPEDFFGERGLLKQLTKGLLERMLQAEMSGHLGYEKHDPAGYGSGNSRNGSSKKRVKADIGEIELAVPRDRESTFEPKIVPKGQTRFPGFDDKILSLYARGLFA
jgi:putative transposase